MFYKDNLSTGRGADHLIRAQAAGLAEMGYDVTIATCSTVRTFTFGGSQKIGIEYVTRDRVRGLASGFDVCIAAGSNEICDLTDGGRLTPPVPTITELMLVPRGFFKWKRFFRNRRIKRAFNKSHVLQILCSSYEDELRRFAPDPEVVVIGEWPDVREPTVEELAGLKRTRVIVYPAAVNKRKNQLLLIRAFGVVADDFPDWELHIYGRQNPLYGRRCEKTVRELGLGNRVKFFPFTDDLPSVYASSEIMAFPSLLEGFPLTVIEGARYGLPSIVVGELPGVVDMNAAGVIGRVSCNDVSAYAEGLRELMADESLRRRLGERVRAAVEQRFKKEIILQEWDELIRRVGNRKGE